MLVLMNSGGIAGTNSFVLADETAKKAVMFDAPDHTVGELLDEVSQRGLDLVGLWITHGHFDHLADHAVVRERFPKAQFLLHALDEPKAMHPDVQLRLFGLSLDIPPFKPDAHVTDNQQLKIGSIEVTVLHTPGHSPGHVVYYLPKEKVLVGGDMIIGGSVGRTDLPDSDPSQMVESLRRMMALPAETRLLPGHGSPSTLAEEQRDNPFLAGL